MRTGSEIIWRATDSWLVERKYGPRPIVGLNGIFFYHVFGDPDDEHHDALPTDGGHPNLLGFHSTCLVNYWLTYPKRNGNSILDLEAHTFPWYSFDLDRGLDPHLEEGIQLKAADGPNETAKKQT